jgi:hypothetical protein
MAKSAKQKGHPQKQDSLWKWVGRFSQGAKFVLVTLGGLYLVQFFVVYILSGPTVSATVSGLRGTDGNAVGCTYYTLLLSAAEPIEYMYAKFQFPTKINNSKVGWGQESDLRAGPSKRHLPLPNDPIAGDMIIVPIMTPRAEGQMSWQVWEAGKNVKGECDIIQAAVNRNEGVQASHAGNMLAIHASKIAGTSFIIGMVATTNGQSSIEPAPPKVSAEGAYEYIKLGQTVRKPLIVTDGGVSDAK